MRDSRFRHRNDAAVFYVWTVYILCIYSIQITSILNSSHCIYLIDMLMLRVIISL